MISNSKGSEEQPLFNNPESLQQLRQELLSLILQDQQSFEALQSSFQLLLDQTCGQTLLTGSEVPQLLPTPLQFLRQAEFQLREKSSCIGTLAQLAVKMIDCIGDQHQHNLQMLETYEKDIEHLREQNECLSSKNIYIQNDVEYFREHLRAAENELQNIAHLQGSVEQDCKDQDFDEKDRQIEMLEQQIERIRAELHFFKFSTRSKKSHLRIKEPQLPLIRSEDALTFLEGQGCSEAEQLKRLENENEYLRRELRSYGVGVNRASKRSILVSKQIQEEFREESERSAVEQAYALKDSVNKSSSLSILGAGLLHNFSKSLELPYFQSPEEVHYQSPTQHYERIHALSSEWSTKSFDVHADVKPSHLIYLNHQEQENCLLQRSNKYGLSSATILQTKETEESIKQMQPVSHRQTRKQVAHAAVNTESQVFPYTEVSRPDKQQASSFFDKLLELQNPLFKRFSSFLVGRKIRRSVHRANESLLMIGC